MTMRHDHRVWRGITGFTAALGLLLAADAAWAQHVPTVDELLQVKRVGSPALSPDGRLVAYTVREADWEDDAYETQIWVVPAAGGEPRQMTRGDNSASAPAWSPDGAWLAFVAERDDTRQVYRIDPTGGEAEPVTASKEGVSSYAWSPDGTSIAYTATDPKPEALVERDKKYGAFEIVDQDPRMTHLHVIDVSTKTPRRLTEGAFTVGRFAWSPDGTAIAFDHRVNGDPSNSGTADISIVTVADRRVRPLVTQDGPDSNPVWSPDATRLAFETAMANPSYYYANGLIATVPAGGGAIEPLTKAFDEDPSLVAWCAPGLFFAASQRTASYLFRLDPSTQATTRLGPEGAILSGYSFSDDCATVAYVYSDARTFPEITVAPAATLDGRLLTRLGAQLDGWTLGASEVISWESKDGAEIEGVLHKPAGFEEGRRYPLLVVIHGGPTGISRPGRISTNSVYPIPIWLARGALVLEPNYRGSAGYGEKFRALNVRNLGIGDAWDVISGVDHLVAQGLADTALVGAMGWSQGGYISAFLTTHDSARFRAISVGAGISDWMTYYVNTDIHPFTRHYLGATPWDDPKIYADTSPITYIKGAKAPTQIQHGENDARVPIPNAYELYQGLQDLGVPSRLIVYKGFGHGLTKPKANRAAMEHNLEWFDKYLFGAPTGR
jgi:dipeptidyl aminopeptidase/acylaminoacyl peptidase